MDYSIAKGPGPGKKKQMKAAGAQYSKAAKENAAKRKAVGKKMDANPAVKKQVGETIMRNNNVAGALKKGLGTLNDAGMYKGTQKAAFTNKEKRKVVKYKKSNSLTPKFKSES